MPDAVQNIFSLGYATLLGLVKKACAGPPVIVEVRPGNLRDLSDPKYNNRLNTNSGDRPQVMLLENRMGFKPFSMNSKAIGFKAAYPLKINSGQQSIGLMNQIATSVVQTLTAAGPNLQLAEVRMWEIPNDAETRAMDVEAGRQNDWSTVLVIVLTYAILRDVWLSQSVTA